MASANANGDYFSIPVGPVCHNHETIGCNQAKLFE